MEAFVAKQVHDYQSGKISRRRLIEVLTVAATTASVAERACAVEPSGLDVALVNHLSYTCPDYRRAADWYSKIFNLDQVGATDHDVALPFGKKGDKPFGVTVTDVPPTHIICRTRPPGGGAGTSRPKATALIDHIAIMVADFDRERAKAELSSATKYRSPASATLRSAASKTVPPVAIEGKSTRITFSTGTSAFSRGRRRRSSRRRVAARGWLDADESPV